MPGREGFETNREIAADLYISEKTASVHVSNIKGKLGASSRVEIALIADRLGLVGDGVDGADGSSATAWAVARAGRPADLCPFKGLAPFEPADAPFYFGRERLIELSRTRLADSSDRSVDVLVSRLRRKLSTAGQAAPIKTVRGVGYIFSAEVSRH